MHTLKLTWKSFLRRKVLSIPMFLLGALHLGNQLYCTLFNKKDPLMGLSDGLRLGPFLFVLFLFLSYEFFLSQKASGLQETLSATRRGTLRLFCNQTLLLVIINAAFTLIAMVGAGASYLLRGGEHPSYLLHMAGVLLVYQFLVDLLGTLMGLAMALFLPRIPAYLWMVFFTLASSDLGMRLFYSIHLASGVKLFWLYDLFSVFPQNLDFAPNHMFGLSLQSFRLQQIGFWLFLTLGLSLLGLKRKCGKWGRVLPWPSLAACALLLALFAQPVSQTLKTLDPYKGRYADLNYYRDRVQETRDGEFTVQRYRLELAMGRELRAKAVLTVDNPALKEYRFTLFHGFQVKQVLDQDNKELPFRQEADRLTVSSQGPVTRLTMTYRGHSTRFYSNAQGTYLPGGFPYYPQSGFHEVYSVPEQGFYSTPCSAPAQFDITIHGGKSFYSNLKQTGENRFSGVATGATLLSGMLEETEVDGVRIVYPYPAPGISEKSYRSVINTMKKQGVFNEEVRQVFLTPIFSGCSYESCAVLSDHVLVNEWSSFPLYYRLQQITEEKMPLQSILNGYPYEKEYYLAGAPDVETGERDPMAVKFAAKLKRLGEKEMLRQCDAYLLNRDDHRTIEEFLAE